MTRFPLLLSAALLATVAAAPAVAQPAPPPPAAGPAAPAERHTVRVTGEGEARAAPDLAVVQLTVLRTAEAADEALTQANEAASAVTEALRGFQIEDRDLQTGGLSITPQYRYENRPDGTSVPPEIIGYEVRNSLTVRVRDLDRLGEILDRAVELGVNQGGDINFQIEDTSDLENEARRDAFEQARRSAATLAEAAGRTLGQAMAISDESATYAPPPPMPMMARSMMAEASAADSSVPVQIGENTVTTRVQVVFELN